MSDVLRKTTTDFVETPTASTSNDFPTLDTAGSPPISVDNQEKPVPEDTQSQTTPSTERQTTNVVIKENAGPRSFMEIQAPMFGMYRDVKDKIDQMLATQDTKASQEATTPETQESLAPKMAALQAASENMRAMWADIYDETVSKLKEEVGVRRDEGDHTWDQAWRLNTLMGQSVEHLLGVSYDVLHPKKATRRDDEASAMKKVGASVYEDFVELLEELSRWKSAEESEYEAKGRDAIRGARHRLEESIQLFCKQYKDYVDQRASRGFFLSPDELNPAKVEAACEGFLSQAEKALQSTSSEGVDGGSSYMRTDHGAEGKSEEATLQALKVDHGRKG